MSKKVDVKQLKKEVKQRTQKIEKHAAKIKKLKKLNHKKRSITSALSSGHICTITKVDNSRTGGIASELAYSAYQLVTYPLRIVLLFQR